MSITADNFLKQYDSVTMFIREVANTGDKKFQQMQAVMEAFTDTLIEKLIAEADKDKIEEYAEKIEKTIKPSTDKYYSLACSRNYKYWNLFQKETREYLLTAYYILEKENDKNLDFSIAVVELSKAIETELREKLYLPFMKWVQPIRPVPNANHRFTTCVENYLANGYINVPFHLMFSLLSFTYAKKNIKNNNPYHDYIDKLYEYVCITKWDRSIICNNTFINAGKQYVSSDRNDAVHNRPVSINEAQECKKETEYLITTFLSAYPRHKQAKTK